MMNAVTSTKPTRIRLTVRGRRVIAGALLAPLAVLGGLAIVTAPDAIANNTVTSGEAFETHTVLSGETLWNIAEEIAGDRDVRDVVAEIQRLNLLDGASLQAGQEIALPKL